MSIDNGPIEPSPIMTMIFGELIEDHFDTTEQIPAQKDKRMDTIRWYLARMIELVHLCKERGKHNYVHGQNRIYCWDCFHNGLEDGIDHDYDEREKIASSVPIDLEGMSQQLIYPYEDMIVPAEYKLVSIMPFDPTVKDK
jgi:hypothetical protein